MTSKIRSFVSLALLSLNIAGPAFAEDKDPLLTDDSPSFSSID